MSLDLTLQPSSDPRDGLGRPLHSNEIIIGLAVGSPRELVHQPAPWESPDLRPPTSPQADSKAEYHDETQQLSQSSPHRQPGRDNLSPYGLKRSGSKWKNLGGLFSRKAPSAPPFDGKPFYMLDRPNHRDGVQIAQNQELLEQPSAVQDPSQRSSSPMEPQAQTMCTAEPPRPSGAKAMLRRASTRRIGIRKRARAQTGSSLESNRGTSAKVRLEERRRSGEAVDASTWLTPNGHEHLRTHAGLTTLANRRGLLEVEIPSVELERYSVMFGDLLKTKSGHSPGLRSTRRRSQMRDFRPAGQEKENNPNGLTFSPLSSNPPLAPTPSRPAHSRKDSSSSTGSKSSNGSAKYGLFPPAGPLQKRNTAHKPPPKPSPLSRSITAPNTNTAPLHRPTASTSKSQGPEELLIVIQESEDSLQPVVDSSKSNSHHHRRLSSFNPSDHSNTSFPVTVIHDDEQYEGEDEYCRPASASETRTEKCVSRSAFPVRKSSMRAPRNSPVTTPPLPSAEILPRALASIPAENEPSPIEGEVAVARQVSISRSQRTVVPIVPQAVRQQPSRVNLVDEKASHPPYPVRKDSHRSYEVIVEA